MSLISGYPYVDITTFRGPWTAMEESDVPMEGSRFAENVEYQPGAVRSRFGFGQLLNPNESVRSLFNWVKTPDAVSLAGNYLFFVNAAGVAKVYFNLASPGGTEPYTLFTQSGMVSASIVSGGNRVYIACQNSSGRGAGQCRIVNINGSAIEVDRAFLGKVAATITPSELPSGDVTAGLHRLGFIAETRTGYQGTISGIIDFTAAGDTQLVFSIAPTTTWPVEVTKVYPVMTTTKNLNRWYLVPSLGAGVPGGSSFTVGALGNISDADLEATGTDVTEHLTLFCQDVVGNGPFNPSVVVEVGNRVGYIAELAGISQMWVSEPEKPQHITADQHVLSLPGFRRMVTAFMMPNGLYILGPNWTYYTSDNGLVPVQWPTMQLVDGRIGAIAPRCVSANPSQGYAWVAHTGGLYLFQGGAYPDKPVSYYVADWWARINWNAAAEIVVVDDAKNQKVRVWVPLDGATQATYRFTFDYTNGTSPEEIAFSPDSWYDNRAIGAGCIGTNPTTGLQEVWEASGTKIYRAKNAQDAQPYNDDGLAIRSQYETSLIPPKTTPGQVRQYHGAHLRVKGAGILNLVAYGMGRTKQISALPITLQASPGLEPLRQWFLSSEQQSLRVRVEEPNGYFLLSAARIYYSAYLTRR